MGSVKAAILRSASQRPIVLCGVLTPTQQDGLLRWVSDIDSYRWVRGDESAHAWRECLLERAEVDGLLPSIPFVAKLAASADRLAAWVNCFAHGEWIGEHRDADGDIQLIIPIKAPSPGLGGDFWIEDASGIVPMCPGDVLVFNAARHPHGTTAPTQREHQRTTLNIRLWLHGHG